MGEYEPNDSRNVTGAANRQGQNEGNPNTNQGGQHWQQGSHQTQPGQQQQFQQGGGQMGGGSGYAGTSAGGMRQQDSGSASRFAGQIREHMEVIGADGVHLGTVDHVDGERIKLTKADSGMGGHQGHHHYLPLGLVADIEGDTVRLSANADVAYGMEEEEGGEAS